MAKPQALSEEKLGEAHVPGENTTLFGTAVEGGTKTWTHMPKSWLICQTHLICPNPGSYAKILGHMPNVKNSYVRRLFSIKSAWNYPEAKVHRAQATPDSSPAIDETQKLGDLLAMATQWSDVSGESDIHEDDL